MSRGRKVHERPFSRENQFQTIRNVGHDQSAFGRLWIFCTTCELVCATVDSLPKSYFQNSIDPINPIRRDLNFILKNRVFSSIEKSWIEI